ncbi:unnamed protein product [Arabidopsis thaliana]|uniref:(thale cress) hypothetical protein n=1 Tax=Arabidopsis thaliana TaxID=3702 RepID=A0A7G2DPH1_ARATH|nr:unnamed protein product [Arabidopsis thaliana]
MSLRPSTRAELRKKIYKTGVDADEARRRREDNLVEIRKNKREDSLLKKRREGMMLQQQLPLGAGLDGPQTAAAVEKRPRRGFRFCGNNCLITFIHQSPTVLIPALRTVGNIVTGDDSQTQFIIENGVLPHLYNLLTQNHKKSIKKEACWTISNITAGNKLQIEAVVGAGIILPLVHLLQNAEFDIKKEAAWAISNATSGGSHEQIQYVISILKRICKQLTSLHSVPS